MDMVTIAAAVGALFAPYFTEEAVALKARRLAHGNVDVAKEVDKARKVAAFEIAEIG